MLYTKSRLLTPIAAAVLLALGSGGAMAATSNGVNAQSATNRQTTTHQQSTNNQQWSANQQSNSSDQQSTDTFREGQLWATYVINPALQAYNIKSDVQGSKVTLQGTVDTKAEKLLAGSIAQEVKGISTVSNEIKVDPTHVVVATFIPASEFAQAVQNATISTEINSRLLWNDYTDGLDINVKTRKGKVTLTGVADTRKAKRRADQIATNTVGVRSVNNQIKVSDSNEFAGSGSHVTDAWITNKIRNSYRFTSGMNTGDIKVNVEGGSVALSGQVDTKRQRQMAINIAQHIHGVHAVKASDLQVAPNMVVATSSD